MVLVSAETLQAFAALGTVAVTLLVAIASGVWAVRIWADEREQTRRQEERLAQDRLQQEAEMRRKEEQLAAERLDQQRTVERQRREDKVAELITALGQAKEGEARLWAASALALYPDETLPLLVTALGHAEEQTTTVINLALASIGPRALPELIRMNRVAQMIVEANSMAQTQATASRPGIQTAADSGGGDAVEPADAQDAAEISRIQSHGRQLASADVVGASQLISCTRAAIAYLILQCGAEELCELDLAGVDLQAMNFAGARLEQVRFRLANLKGAVFAHARLGDGNFRGANLAGAVFLRAAANGADFTGIQGPIRAIRMSAVRANFEHARLDKSVLSAARLQGSSFLDSSLQGAHVSGADLTGAQIRNARWGGVVATKSTLKACRFIHAQLGNAQLAGARAGGASFTQHCGMTGLQAQGFLGPDAVFEDCNLGGSNFENANFQGENFTRCNLGGVRFDKVRLEGATFDACNLSSVSFRGAKLKGTRFVGVQVADPARLDLGGANWQDAIFDGESKSLHDAFATAAGSAGQDPPGTEPPPERNHQRTTTNVVDQHQHAPAGRSDTPKDSVDGA